MNNYLVLLVSNITALFSNVLKEIMYLILCKIN